MGRPSTRAGGVPEKLLHIGVDVEDVSRKIRAPDEVGNALKQTALRLEAPLELGNLRSGFFKLARHGPVLVEAARPQG